MALRITIDLFSGRPNPSVVVTGMDERELLDRLGTFDRRSARAPRAAAAPSAKLGYRGLIVEPVAAAGESGARTGRKSPRVVRTAAAPAALRVAQGVVQHEGRAIAARDPGVEAFVVSPTGPFRTAGFPARFFEHLASEVTRPARDVQLRAAARADAGAGACACAPLFEPQWWNDSGSRQLNNNCYNYATNYRTDTYAQPGRANGAMYAAMTAADVSAAAIADALIATPAKNRCPRKGHLVAMFTYEWDYHWYRKQRSGNWTHKPGTDPVTELDNANAPITDPRTADRGPYTQFGGFLIVMHGHVKIA
jgi:hypothetical protein